MLLSLLSVLVVSRIGASARRHGNNGLLAPPPNVNDDRLPPDQWFTQKLDHSQPGDLRTWQQRYFTNASFYREGGPVFLMIGGEGVADAVWMVTGSWIEYARQHGALCFQLEHRFYGKSHPTRDMGVKNLRYLSSEQALADLAAFSAAMQQQHALPNNTKWVAFGGSYPGSLAAWYRLKYPHMVHAAVSSSAPLTAKTNFFEFLSVVSDAVRAESGDACYANIAAAFAELEERLNNENSWRAIERQLKLCNPISGSSLDTSSLISSLADVFGNTVQYNLDNRAFEGAKDANITVSMLCDLMSDGAGTPLDRLSAVNAAWLSIHGDECLDYGYQSEMNKLRQESFNSPDNTGIRQWMYQTCSEFGWYQTSDFKQQPFGHRLPLSFSVQQCTDAFGTKYNTAFIEAAVKATNIRYGGRGIRVKRVVFVNGSIDPWHAMGLTVTRRTHAPVIYINGTAHCANMYPPRDEDLPQLKAARHHIGRLLQDWLREQD